MVHDIARIIYRVLIRQGFHPTADRGSCSKRQILGLNRASKQGRDIIASSSCNAETILCVVRVSTIRVYSYVER